jgi:hypothetical protein
MLVMVSILFVLSQEGLISFEIGHLSIVWLIANFFYVLQKLLLVLLRVFLLGV